MRVRCGVMGVFCIRWQAVDELADQISVPANEYEWCCLLPVAKRVAERLRELHGVREPKFLEL